MYLHALLRCVQGVDTEGGFAMGTYPESSKPKGLTGWSLERGELIHLKEKISSGKEEMSGPVCRYRRID